MRAVRIALAAIVLLAGVLGLWRGYDQPGDLSGSDQGTGTEQRAITVTGATVLASDGPDTAARLTVRNGTGVDDVLRGISSGAGRSTTVAGPPTGVPIDNAQTIEFGVGANTITITGLYGPLVPGQVIALSLDFQRAGAILVEASVVAP